MVILDDNIFKTEYRLVVLLFTDHIKFIGFEIPLLNVAATENVVS